MYDLFDYLTRNLRISKKSSTFAPANKTNIMRKTLLFICACAMALTATATQYVGGDISMLTKYEQNNSAYLDPYGNEIPDLIPYFVNKCKWNTFRVRIFVNPAGGSDGVIQNTEYVAAQG